MNSRPSEPAAPQQVILLVILTPFSNLPFDQDSDGEEVTKKVPLIIIICWGFAHCGYHSYKHVYEGGRRGGKLVYSCGENGDCPPRRSAHRS